MMGGGLASDTSADSTGDDGVEVGSSGSASLLDVTPLSVLEGMAYAAELPTASRLLEDEEADWSRAELTGGRGGTMSPSFAPVLLLLEHWFS